MYQRICNHYEMQQITIFIGKIIGFSTLGVADIFREPCNVHSKVQIPPFQEWQKIGSAKTDLVRFKRGFGEGLLKDKFAFFKAYKNPIPKRRKLLAKRPFYKQKGRC